MKQEEPVKRCSVRLSTISRYLDLLGRSIHLIIELSTVVGLLYLYRE